MKYFAKFVLACMVFSIGCSVPEAGGQKVVFQSMGEPVRKQAWQGPYPDGIILTTAHYRIYTTSQSAAATMPGFMEQAHDYYQTLTGLEGARNESQGQIYMLANRDQWADVTRKLVKDQPKTYLSIQAGGYCYKGTCVFWDIGDLQTLPVAAHEGLHQYFMANLRDQLPMWAEEGLCVLAEGFKIRQNKVDFDKDSWSHFEDLRNAFKRNYWQPLDRLLEMDAGDALNEGNKQAVAYYAQLWSMMHYIRSQPKYRAGLQRMIADARDGRTASELGVGFVEMGLLKSNPRKYNSKMSPKFFRKYITADLATFDREYTQYAKELATKG